MASSGTLDMQKRILCEVQDNQNVLHELAKGKDGNEPLSSDTKLQFAHAQGKYSNLKLDFNSLQTKAKLLHYLENVPNRDEWATACVSEEESKQTHRDLRKIKQDIRDTQEELEELTEQANNEQDEFDSQLKLLQDKLEAVEQKEKRLADLKAKHSNRLSSLCNGNANTMGNFDDQLHLQTAALQKAESLLPTYQQAACELKQEISRLVAAKEAMRVRLEEAKPGLERMKEVKDAEMKKHSSMATWCKNTLAKLSHLSGIKQHSFHDDTMTLELVSPGDSSVTALLSLHFMAGQHAYSPWQLKNAQLSIESLDISDIVDEAVRINDMVFLVNQVKTRLYSHAPLRHEVEDLRHRYALDWLSEEGLIRVMMGDKGQVVCTLTIQSGYPAIGSEVRLTAVEGLQEQVSLESFKPTSEYPTITEWMDYLHAKIGSG